jgi:hypothetical protein
MGGLPQAAHQRLACMLRVGQGTLVRRCGRPLPAPALHLIAECAPDPGGVAWHRWCRCAMCSGVGPVAMHHAGSWHMMCVKAPDCVKGVFCAA